MLFSSENNFHYTGGFSLCKSFAYVISTIVPKEIKMITQAWGTIWKSGVLACSSSLLSTPPEKPSLRKIQAQTSMYLEWPGLFTSRFVTRGLTRGHSDWSKAPHAILRVRLFCSKEKCSMFERNIKIHSLWTAWKFIRIQSYRGCEELTCWENEKAVYSSLNKMDDVGPSPLFWPQPGNSIGLKRP